MHADLVEHSGVTVWWVKRYRTYRNTQNAMEINSIICIIFFRGYIPDLSRKRHSWVAALPTQPL